MSIQLTADTRTPGEYAEALERIETELARWSELLFDQRRDVSRKVHGVLADKVSVTESSQRSAEAGRWMREAIVALDEAKLKLGQLSTVLKDKQVVNERWI